MAVFPAFADTGQRKNLETLNQEMLTRTPVQQFQYVDVTFSAANTDTGIPHTLKVSDVNAVRWVMVSVNAAASIYRSTTGAATPWQANQIWLRASAICIARLYVFVEA